MTALPLLLVIISAFAHATWNLLAHTQRSSRTLFLQVAVITVLIGGAPVLLAELYSTPFPAEGWCMLPLAGVFQTLYFVGLTYGYRSGDFTVVYPVARALPVLILAFVDVWRGNVPSTMAWVGIFLVCAGCVVMPLESLR